MTPAEFEWAQEQAELAYQRGLIDAMTFRKRMYALGFTPQGCDDRLDELDEGKCRSVKNPDQQSEKPPHDPACNNS